MTDETQTRISGGRDERRRRANKQPDATGPFLAALPDLPARTPDWDSQTRQAHEELQRSIRHLPMRPCDLGLLASYFEDLQVCAVMRSRLATADDHRLPALLRAIKDLSAETRLKARDLGLSPIGRVQLGWDVEAGAATLRREAEQSGSIEDENWTPEKLDELAASIFGEQSLDG